MKALKQIVWMGNSLSCLKAFPDEVRDGAGYSLYKLQEGAVSKNIKQLKGTKPAVMEVVLRFDSNTYRLVYTVKIAKVIYVLHCFQKKSTSGVKTPKHDIELIKQRLKEAKMLSQE